MSRQRNVQVVSLGTILSFIIHPKINIVIIYCCFIPVRLSFVEHKIICFEERLCPNNTEKLVNCPFNCMKNQYSSILLVRVVKYASKNVSIMQKYISMCF